MVEKEEEERRMIYLASPYTHDDPAIMKERYEGVCRVAARLMKQGHYVYSPIAHSHGIAQYGLPLGWEYWERISYAFLNLCKEIWVVTMPGWRHSIGVLAEIAHAEAQGKPVRYVSAEEIGVTDVPRAD